MQSIAKNVRDKAAEIVPLNVFHQRLRSAAGEIRVDRGDDILRRVHGGFQVFNRHSWRQRNLPTKVGRIQNDRGGSCDLVKCPRN